MEAKYLEMNIVLNNIDTGYHEASKKFGITDAEFDVLYFLAQTEEYIPQKDIYQKTGISKTTINTAIKKMEREKLLEISAVDGRSTQLKLTDEGRKLAYDSVRKVIEIENDIYDGWSEKDKKIALRLMTDFRDKFISGVSEL